MGRYLEGGEVADNAISGDLKISGTLPTKIAPPGYLGEFGSGLWRTFALSGVFEVPAGVSRIRVRVVGGGGGGASTSRGGGGGGYAHGVFDVIPLSTHNVTVGMGGVGGSTGGAGGTSSFAALISASGGSQTSGGTGTGGDFRATGGVSGAAAGSGGGGAASQLGNGGSTFAGLSGGAGVASGSTVLQNTGGASAFGSTIDSRGGPDVTGNAAISGQNGSANGINAVIRFYFDGFTGGGGAYASANSPGGIGGIGAGGGCGLSNTAGGAAGVGGGGGGGAAGGPGGIGGGGGGAIGAAAGGVGGNGLIIVEF